MNEIDIATPAGCIGGPHARGAEDDCSECALFRDPVLACWRAAQSIDGGPYLSTHYIASFLAALKTYGHVVVESDPRPSASA